MRTRGAMTLLAVASALALAGCSDDEASAPPTTSTTAAAPSTTAAEPGRCGTVLFTPDSEDLATDVTAFGLPCAEAVAFVEKAGRQTGADGPDRAEVDGWACERTASVTDPLPTSTFSCTQGAKKVTYVRS